MAKGDYTLTQEEYNTLCHNFYRMEALTKTLRHSMESNLYNQREDVNSADVMNIAEMISEMLSEIKPLLGK